MSQGAYGMLLVKAGAVMLPVVLTAFAGYRGGWRLPIIAAVIAGVMAVMCAMVFWGLET